MKRYDHLYEKIYDLENLRKAHQHAKKGKGWYREVQEIDKDPDKYLKQIQEMLINHTYRILSAISFQVEPLAIPLESSARIDRLR